MRKRLYIWQLAGFLFSCVSGVLLHFLYNWSGQNFLVATFAAVNESIWEHMKLLFFPMTLFAVIQSNYLKEKYENFWCAKLSGIMAGLILVPVLYYTYTGVLGVKLDWLNIFIFFIAVGGSYFGETWFLKHDRGYCILPKIAGGVLYMLALIFILFTFRPPQMPLFQDPVTGIYGISEE